MYNSTLLLQTWNQYVSEYTRRFELLLKEHSNARPFIEDGAYMFDAIWTAALALNKTQSRLKEKNLSLKNFTYRDEHDISGYIYQEALKLEFFGLSVSICMTIEVALHYHQAMECL